MTDNEEIDCDRHGRGLPAMLCGHLLNAEGGPRGFIENSSDPEDLQAWCQACEDLYEVEQDLTEAFRAFNDMSLVCVACYAELRNRHQ